MKENMEYLKMGFFRAVHGTAVAVLTSAAWKLFDLVSGQAGYKAIGLFAVAIAVHVLAFLAMWWLGGGRFKKEVSK